MFIAGETFSLTLAITPSVDATTVTLDIIHGVDGEEAGTDEDGVALVFPVTMTAGVDGLFSCSVNMPETGVYWATFTVDGMTRREIIRIGDGSSSPMAGEPYTVAAIIDSAPTGVTLVVGDATGEAFGTVNDEAVVWPSAMTAVPGYDYAWYFADLVFSDPGVAQFRIVPTPGPIITGAVQVATATEVSTSAVADFEADSDINPDAWITLSHIRRWTGWSSSVMPAEDLRAIRRLAIEWFIHTTHGWVPPWDGTFHLGPPQGSRLYLPVAVVLPSSSGVTPTLTYVEMSGDREEVQTIDNDDLVWHTGYDHRKQPYVEIIGGWMPDLGVKIHATWGVVDRRFSSGGVFRQAMVGLVRWCALSFGRDADEAKEQSTLYRIEAESNRDQSVRYSPAVVSNGLTGDTTIDRILAEFRVETPPRGYTSGGR